MKAFGARAGWLSLEPLEERIAPASAVTASISGGALSLVGGDEADAVGVDVAGLAAGQIRVTGGIGTLVNGEAAVVLDGWTGGIKAKMGDGDDTLILAVAATDVQLDLGKGDDILDATAPLVASGKVAVKAGDGDDTMDFVAVTVGKDFSVDGGNGFNQLDVDGATVTGKFAVKNGSGVDYVMLADVHVTKDLTISNGSGTGASVILMEDCSALSLKAASTDGYDNPVIIGLSTVKGISISTGNGGCGIRLQDFTCGAGVSIKSGGDAGAGNVTYVVRGLINDGLSVSSGKGDGGVVIESTHVGLGPKLGDLKVSVGAGQKGIIFTEVDANRKLSLSCGDGRTEITFDGVSVDKDLSVKTKGGLDTGEIINTSVFGKASFDTGAAVDMFSFDYCNFIHDFSFKAGAGNDVLEMEADEIAANPQTNFGGKVKIDMGADDDTLVIGVFDVTDSAANFDDMVALVGGKGSDTVDWQDNGNDFFVPPSVKDFETIS